MNTDGADWCHCEDTLDFLQKPMQFGEILEDWRKVYVQGESGEVQMNKPCSSLGRWQSKWSWKVFPDTWRTGIWLWVVSMHLSMEMLKFYPPNTLLWWNDWLGGWGEMALIDGQWNRLKVGWIARCRGLWSAALTLVGDQWCTLETDKWLSRWDWAHLQQVSWWYKTRRSVW